MLGLFLLQLRRGERGFSVRFWTKAQRWSPRGAGRGRICDSDGHSAGSNHWWLVVKESKRTPCRLRVQGVSIEIETKAKTMKRCRWCNSSRCDRSSRKIERERKRLESFSQEVGGRKWWGFFFFPRWFLFVVCYCSPPKRKNSRKIMKITGRVRKKDQSFFFKQKLSLVEDNWRREGKMSELRVGEDVV